VLGGTAAGMLRGIGFQLAGWSRSPKNIEGVKSFHGDDQLMDLVAWSDILVSILPKTPQTENILNADLFARMPKGTSLINAGRGDQLVEEDLVAALDSGQLSQATLDVFRSEPLPADHLFWTHPKITVTPHSGGDPFPETAAKAVAENILRFRRGEPLPNIAHPEDGY
jgi:glyoxylate/hydroxypyruvate reductase A